MSWRHSWALALQNLSRHPLRSFLMMLGVGVAIAALTVVSAIGEGTRQEVLTKMERFFGPRDLLLTAGGGHLSSSGLLGQPGANLKLADVQAISEAIENIDLFDPYQVSGALTLSWQAVTRPTRVFGYGVESEAVWERPAVRGRYFDVDELARCERVALIGQHAASELFGALDPVGQRIRLGTVPFEIIGLLGLIGPDPHGMDHDDELIVPITTMMSRLMNVDTIRGAKFRLRDASRSEESAAQVRELLRARHGLRAGEPDDFGLITPLLARNFVAQAGRVFRLFLPLLSGVALLVGALVVANLQLMSVRERVSEIGLRMALGARARDIRTLLLLETASLTTVAGLLGIAFGLLVGRAVEVHLGQAVATPWLALASGLGLSLAAGLVAGLLPARRAAAIEPALALRT